MMRYTSILKIYLLSFNRQKNGRHGLRLYSNLLVIEECK